MVLDQGVVRVPVLDLPGTGTRGTFFINLVFTRNTPNCRGLIPVRIPQLLVNYRQLVASKSRCVLREVLELDDSCPRGQRTEMIAVNSCVTYDCGSMESCHPW